MRRDRVPVSARAVVKKQVRTEEGWLCFVQGPGQVTGGAQ